MRALLTVPLLSSLPSGKIGLRRPKQRGKARRDRCVELKRSLGKEEREQCRDGFISRGPVGGRGCGEASYLHVTKLQPRVPVAGRSSVRFIKRSAAPEVGGQLLTRGNIAQENYGSVDQ